MPARVCPAYCLAPSGGHYSVSETRAPAPAGWGALSDRRVARGWFQQCQERDEVRETGAEQRSQCSMQRRQGCSRAASAVALLPCAACSARTVAGLSNRSRKPAGRGSTEGREPGSSTAHAATCPALQPLLMAGLLLTHRLARASSFAFSSSLMGAAAAAGLAPPLAPPPAAAAAAFSCPNRSARCFRFASNSSLLRGTCWEWGR